MNITKINTGSREGFQGISILVCMHYEASNRRAMNWNIIGNRFVTGALGGFLLVPFFFVRNCPHELI